MFLVSEVTFKDITGLSHNTPFVDVNSNEYKKKERVSLLLTEDKPNISSNTYDKQLE